MPHVRIDLAGAPNRVAVDLGRGQAYVVGSLEWHQWRSTPQGAGLLTFLFSPSVLSQMPSMAGLDPLAVFRSSARTGPIGSTRQAHRALAALGNELVRKHQQPIPPGRACVDLLRLLELILLELDEGQAAPADADDGVFAASRIQPAMDLFQRLPYRRIALAEAAAACGMSRSTFARMFKSVTGTGFAAFTLRWRLALASYAIANTDTPIKVVAREFGFRHTSHFHSAFTSLFQITPGQWQRRAR